MLTLRVHICILEFIQKNFMRKVLGVLIILTIPFLLMQFNASNGTTNLKIKVQAEGLVFLAKCKTLNKIAEQLRLNNTSQIDFQKQLLVTRKAYKQIEFIFDYYYPSFSEDHINGAPLLHAKRFDNRPLVEPAEGLQILDELAFADLSEEDKSQLIILSKLLFNKTQLMLNGFKNQNIETHEVFEASRLALIKVFTMGITGFDTPGSLNGLEEAQIVLKALEQSMLELKMLDAEESHGLAKLFKMSNQALFNQSFETFDRLTFLTEYINPLYKQLLQVQKAKGFFQKSKISTSVNFNAENIFEADFLDPYHFTELSREEDSKALRLLGKQLFYDSALSESGAINCATCHNPAKGFTDGLSKSKSSVSGKTVQRNAPTLLNAVYADRYFYDLRAFSLEQQAEHVIFNNQEFNTAYESILEKLNTNPRYKSSLKVAFGAKQINRSQFSKALASYVLSLQSFNSPFDKYVRNETESLSAEAKVGFNLFMGKAACGTCHFAPTFSGLVPPMFTKNETEILGVLQNPNGWGKGIDADKGRYENEILSEKAWIYERSFKTSTVRNAAVTAPYFHNGAYKTLEAVVDFYNHGGGAGLGIEVKNQTLAADSLNLSITEKQALVAFMESLTDTASYKN